MIKENLIEEVCPQEQPTPKPAIKKLTPEQLLKRKGGSGTGIVIDDIAGF